MILVRANRSTAARADVTVDRAVIVPAAPERDLHVDRNRMMMRDVIVVFHHDWFRTDHDDGMRMVMMMPPPGMIVPIRPRLRSKRESTEKKRGEAGSLNHFHKRDLQATGSRRGTHGIIHPFAPALVAAAKGRDNTDGQRSVSTMPSCHRQVP